jgi:hypothetical protein
MADAVEDVLHQWIRHDQETGVAEKVAYTRLPQIVEDIEEVVATARHFNALRSPVSVDRLILLLLTRGLASPADLAAACATPRRLQTMHRLFRLQYPSSFFEKAWHAMAATKLPNWPRLSSVAAARHALFLTAFIRAALFNLLVDGFARASMRWRQRSEGRIEAIIPHRDLLPSDGSVWLRLDQPLVWPMPLVQWEHSPFADGYPPKLQVDSMALPSVVQPLNGVAYDTAEEEDDFLEPIDASTLTHYPAFIRRTEDLTTYSVLLVIHVVAASLKTVVHALLAFQAVEKKEEPSPSLELRFLARMVDPTQKAWRRLARLAVGDDEWQESDESLVRALERGDFWDEAKKQIRV